MALAMMTLQPSNKPTFADLMQVANDLGIESGKGKDTQIKFHMKLVEAAYLGAIDDVDNKHGQGIDDATKLAEVYNKAQTGAVVFDAKAPNQRKLISTARLDIKLGMWPKGGAGEPLATVNNLLNHRQKLRKDPAQAKKLDDAVNVLHRYARAQLKRDSLVLDDELQAMCFKPLPGKKTLDEFYSGEMKRWNNIIAGRGDIHDNGGLAVQIRECIKERIKEIVAEKNPQASGTTLIAANDNTETKVV